MKQIIFLSVIIFVFAFFCSCGNSGGDNSAKPAMFCLVNSTNWRSPEPKAILTETSIKVFGTSANGQTIILNVGSPQKGEYTANAFTGCYAEFIPNMSAGAARYSTLNSESAYGTIKIESINEESKTMSGSFSFKAYRSTDNTFRTINDGVFTNVPYHFYSNSDTTYQNIFYYSTEGRTWYAKDITAQKNDTALVIFADCNRTETWQSVTMWMSPTIGSGVHYITADGPIYAKFQKGFSTYDATNGSVTIVENNSTTKKFRGTFFFNYKNENDETIAISDGAFDIKFTEESE
ncbi:MAG: DUF6252 family protein [Bacteroidales bacterium]